MENLHEQPNRKPLSARLGSLIHGLVHPFGKAGEPDSQVIVRNHDWPAGRSEDDLTLEEADALVFNQWDTFYPGAVAGLARTEVPTAEPPHEQ